jgi:hypothetical protein
MGLMHFHAVLYVHILCMLGAIGVLVGCQLCVPWDTRNSAGISRSTAKVANTLIGIGLLAGLGYYAMKSGHTLGPHYNGVIGVKFVFLLGAGALIGISKRTDSGDLLRWIAVILLVLAGFFGSTLSL